MKNSTLEARGLTMNGTNTSDIPQSEVAGGVPWQDSYPDPDSPGVRANLDVIRELPVGQPEHSSRKDRRKPQTSKPRKATKVQDAKPIPEEAEIETAREVDGDEELASAAIVEAIEVFLRRYVVLPAGLYLVLTLWAIGTYFALFFDAYAYLAVTGPTMRCGKSRVLELLEMLSWRPFKATSTSESALFRMLAKSPGFPPPTLLIDEAESLRNGKDARAVALNSILNSGYRAGQNVPRTVPKGNDFEVVFFPTFGPKALACIGNLPPTLQDRSIEFPMQRRAPSEPLDRFNFARARKESASIRNSLCRRDREGKAVLVQSEYSALPDLPFLSDRDAEISLPLFAVCRVFAPERESELRATLLRIFGEKAGRTEDENVNQRLLADLKSVWPDGEENASTTQLLANLKTIDDSPWANGYELNPRKMARMLAGFGIKSRTVRIGDKTAKGYFRSSFEPAWSRYLSLPEGPAKVTPSQPALTEAANNEPCDVVTDRPHFQRETETDFPPDPETESEV